MVGLLSSAAWPAIVLCIPAGITFFAGRVFAESGVATLEPCDASAFASCADAGELAFCSDVGCRGASCGCIRQGVCAGATSRVLACKRVSTCDLFEAQRVPCEAKSPGESCVAPYDPPDSGRCWADTCLTPDDGGFITTNQLVCYGVRASSQPGPDASTFPPLLPSGESTPPRVFDDSGCTASSGSAQGTAVVICLPLAVSLLLSRRRRR